ncbi:MAG: hypothetical protein V1928_01500 [Parcubacteria group bacterium]
MPNLSLNKQPANIVHLQINRISYLAFIEIFFKYDFLSYEIKPAEGFYSDSDLKYDAEYAAIVEKLLEISLTLQQDDVLPFGRMFEAQIALSTHGLLVFANKLSRSPLAELRELGKELRSLAGISQVVENNVADETNNIDFRQSKADSEIRILDKDNSFENKLIFHHLFQTQSDPIEKIAEKAEMMTPEQKEKVFSQILGANTTRLPKSILHQSFCAIEIIAPFFELKSLIKCPQIKTLTSSFTTAYGHVTPDCIVHSNQYESYLSAVELIKKYFRETNNLYAISQTFKQRLIVSADLHFLNVIKKSEAPLGKKIFLEIEKAFPFINMQKM